MHKISEKKYVCLPYLKFSELLSETHWHKQTLFEDKIVKKILPMIHILLITFANGLD